MFNYNSLANLNVDQVIELLKKDKTINKYTLLIHYGEHLHRLDMVKKLLKSGVYTPEELASRPASTYNHLKDNATRTLLLDFASKAWKKSNSAEKMINTRNGLVGTKEKDWIMKLDYYIDHKPKVYDKMADIIVNKSNIF